MNDDDSDSSRTTSFPPRVAFLLIGVLSAVILLRAPTRDYALSALHPWPNPINIPAYEAGDDSAWTKNAYAEDHRRFAASLARHPSDPALSFAVRVSPTGGDDLAIAKHECDQSPQDFRLLGYYLTLACDNLHNVRCDGPLTNASWPAKNPYPFRPFNLYEKSILHDVIVRSRRGIEFDPDNGYFDWSLATALLQEKRDNEAIQHLLAAARKPSFTDYGRLYAPTMFFARSRERPLLPEEFLCFQYIQISLGLNNLRHYTSRLIMEHVIAARSRGDAASALAISTALLKIGEYMRHGHAGQVGFYDGSKIMKSAILDWQVSTAFSMTSRVPSLTRQDNLAGYAAAHGNRPLAQQVMTDFYSPIFNLKDKRSFEDYGIGNPSYFSILLNFCLRWFVSSLPLFGLIWILALIPKVAGSQKTVPGPRSVPVLLGILGASLALITFLTLDFHHIPLSAKNRWLSFMFLGGDNLQLTSSFFVSCLPPSILVLSAFCGGSVWAKSREEKPLPWREIARQTGFPENPTTALLIRVSASLLRILIWTCSLALLGWTAYAYTSFNDHRVNVLGWTCGLFPALCGWQILQWRPHHRFAPALSQTAAILRLAIPIYVGLWLSILGISILLITPFVNVDEQKIIAGMKSQELSTPSILAKSSPRPAR